VNGQDDHGGAGQLRLDAPGRLDPVQRARHVDVHQDDLGRVEAGELQRLVARRRLAEHLRPGYQRAELTTPLLEIAWSSTTSA
jgi:hypothetical protein